MSLQEQLQAAKLKPVGGQALSNDRPQTAQQKPIQKPMAPVQPKPQPPAPVKKAESVKTPEIAALKVSSVAIKYPTPKKG